MTDPTVTKGASAVSCNMPILEVSDLSKRFGGVNALTDYSLRLDQGELLGLIGPNGAGKTTVFNLLTGVVRPSSGTIVFAGRNVTNQTAHRFAALGISRTFQTTRIFNDMTVLENVMAALHPRQGTGLVATVLGFPKFRRAEKAIQTRGRELLALLGLEDLSYRRAGNLAYGDQRRVEIARALATEPRLLLLDEPAAGMNPRETDNLKRMIFHIHQAFGLTIILVEHDMKLVMGLCSKVQVIDRGSPLAMGTPDEIQTNPMVIEAYLGRRQEYA